MTCMMRGVFVEETGDLGRLEAGLVGLSSRFCWAEWEKRSSSVESRMASMECGCGGDVDCGVDCDVDCGVDCDVDCGVDCDVDCGVDCDGDCGVD